MKFKRFIVLTRRDYEGYDEIDPDQSYDTIEEAKSALEDFLIQGLNDGGMVLDCVKQETFYEVNP